MLKFICQSSSNSAICLILTAVFLFSYPTGSAALSLCLDQEENHIVDRNLYLDNCHSSTGTYLPLSQEHCSASEESENNDCVDVSLTNDNILNRLSKTALPAIAKIFLSYTLPSNLAGFQQQVIVQNPHISFQIPSNILHLKIHRATVLLI